MKPIPITELVSHPITLLSLNDEHPLKQLPKLVILDGRLGGHLVKLLQLLKLTEVRPILPKDKQPVILVLLSVLLPPDPKSRAVMVPLI
jgi:hypothetical protein